jgi:hypothetical protein
MEYILPAICIIILYGVLAFIRKKVGIATAKAVSHKKFKGTKELADTLTSQIWNFQVNSTKEILIDRIRANFPPKLSTFAIMNKWICKIEGNTLDFIIGTYKPIKDYSSVRHAIGKMSIHENSNGSLTVIFLFTSIAVQFDTCPFAKQMEELIDQLTKMIKEIDILATVTILPRQ